MVSVSQVEGTDSTARTPTPCAAIATWGKASPCSYRSRRSALAVRNEVRQGPSSLSYCTRSSSSATMPVIAAVAGRPPIAMAMVAASQLGTETVAASAMLASAPPSVRWVCSTSASCCRLFTRSSDNCPPRSRWHPASDVPSRSTPLGASDDVSGDVAQLPVLLLGLLHQRVERLVRAAPHCVHDDALGHVDHLSAHQRLLQMLAPQPGPPVRLGVHQHDGGLRRELPERSVGTGIEVECAH